VSSETLSKPLNTSSLKKFLSSSFVAYFLAVLVAFIVSGIFIAAMGYNVLKAYQTILFTSFRTENGFIQTLSKFVPLTLLALSFTVPLATGKFNVGGEGQFLMGAIGATTVGILLSQLPQVVLLPLEILASIIFGGIWGLIPGWLLYKFKINEILTTVCLNFISFSLVNYIATSVFPDPTAGHPTTLPVGEGGFMPMLIKNPPLSAGIILMLIIAVGVYIFTNRTTTGYDLVATGANPRAASVYGINVRVMFVLGMVVAGALAGLAGGMEVAGYQHNLIEGMHSNYKVLGIIIGLMSQGSNLVVPFVAFFISVLEVGASAMQRTLMIPVEMVYIVEAVILIFVLMSNVVRRR
jgi:ABC-type uncharacterized transport system permease subunit